MASAKSVASSLKNLNISSNKPKKNAPADSWEDEASDDGVRTPTNNNPETPGPPPPTPSSPSFSPNSYSRTPLSVGAAFDTSPTGSRPSSRPGSSGVATPDKRPEKSTAVASRLIAAGIGQKAPRRTKEEREYDAAMKKQEARRREQAKEEEERKRQLAEKAKRDMWGD